MYLPPEDIKAGERRPGRRAVGANREGWHKNKQVQGVAMR